MDFDLTQDQREIQALTRDFAKAEIEPECLAVGPRPPLPARALRQARRARADGCVRAGGVRRRGRRLPLVHPRPGGALTRRRGSRRDRGGAHERGDAADPRLRHRRAEVAVRPAARARRASRRVRADRSRGGLGRGRDPHEGRAGGRRLDDHGREAMDHERPLLGHVSPLRPHRPEHRRRARRQRLHPRCRARARHARRGEARSQLVRDERHRRRGCARRPRPAAARGEPRLPRRDDDARRRAHRHRRAGARHRAGCLRRRPRIRAASGARSVTASATSRRSSTSSRTCRWRSTPRACSSTAPRG